VSPNSHNAWNNIGDDYDKLAQLETTDEGKMKQYLNAIKGFGQSFMVKPNYADAYHNQANIFYKIGRLDLARGTYEQALNYNPNLSQTLKTLIQLDIMEKNPVELEKHLVRLQQMDPTSVETAYIAAISYAQIGMIDKAKIITNELYKQFPTINEIKSLYDNLMSMESSQSAELKN
jgi:tetratricopeptide (TPR) repeat protein